MSLLFSLITFKAQKTLYKILSKIGYSKFENSLNNIFFVFSSISDFIRPNDGHAGAACKRRFEFGQPIRKSSRKNFRNPIPPWRSEISRIATPEPKNSSAAHSSRVRDYTSGLRFEASSVETQTVRKSESKFETRVRFSESLSKERNRKLRSKSNNFRASLAQVEKPLRKEFKCSQFKCSPFIVADAKESRHFERCC